MGKKDTKAKEYLSDNERFADLCNFALFHGEKVLSATDLVEQDSTEVLSILGVNQDEVNHQQKWRDLLKLAVVRATSKAVYVLIGIENQSDVHYAMPVRCMIYDALNYGAQVREAAKKHNQKKDYESAAEFLSGLQSTDRLTPIIPITLYLGAKKWDAPTSLHEMFGELDDRLKSYVPDYKIVLVAPSELEDSDLNQFSTELRELLGTIKYSQDMNKLQNFVVNSPRFKALDNETIEAINVFTNTEIEINKEGGVTDMCKAIEDMKMEAAERGIEKGIVKGIEKGKLILLIELVASGDISVERAAGVAGMTVEEFKEKMQEQMVSA